MSLPKDHIYVILIAFLAALACFTACAMVGVEATVIGTLRDVCVAMGGVLGGVAYGTKKSGDAPTQ
jgi:hypothetical protein